jgi:hypothetical protein
MKHHSALLILGLLLTSTCPAIAAEPAAYSAKVDGDRIVITRDGIDVPIVVQIARKDFRPYLHPITAPDGRGELTQYSPGHHKHQTGLYWGFTRVNGRDYFHHPGDGYWQLNAKQVVKGKGSAAGWQTSYDLIGADNKPVLTEVQTWTISASDNGYVLDLEWSGTARGEVTFSKYAYGGLFLRMPWARATGGTAINSEGLANGKAEGQRARWVDVGMPIKGRDNWGHIVIMDHPKNDGHPIAWRVDGQLGVGPCRARLGEWKLDDGATATFRHRFLIYTGKTDTERTERAWKAFIN